MKGQEGRKEDMWFLRVKVKKNEISNKLVEKFDGKF